MTKFLFTAVAVLSCTLLFASNSFPSPHTSTDSGFVYIYRVGQFGGALSNFSVFVDGQKLCKISNNKYFKVYLTPGTHTISAKVGGLSIMKKETEVELEVTKGSAEYYVACNMKTSITRARLEMIEVTKSSGKKQMENMSEDKCQEKIDKE